MGISKIALPNAAILITGSPKKGPLPFGYHPKRSFSLQGRSGFCMRDDDPHRDIEAPYGPHKYTLVPF